MEAFVHSSAWMALSLASLVPFVQLESALRLDFRPFWAAACESMAVYTLDHLRDLRRARSRGDGPIGHRPTLLRALFSFSTAGFVACLVAAHSWRVNLVFVGHAALCATYAKLKPRIPYLKAAYVSLCVIFMAVAAPAAYAAPGAVLGALGTAALVRLLLVMFCVSFTIEHLQDVRDIDEDRKAGVVTLPSGLGEQTARRALLAVQAACVALHVCVTRAGVLEPRPDLLAIHALCGAGALCFRAETPRSLFQVVLEPLYAVPLAAALLRACLAGSLM